MKGMHRIAHEVVSHFHNQHSEKSDHSRKYIPRSTIPHVKHEIQNEDEKNDQISLHYSFHPSNVS